MEPHHLTQIGHAQRGSAASTRVVPARNRRPQAYQRYQHDGQAEVQHFCQALLLGPWLGGSGGWRRRRISCRCRRRRLSCRCCRLRCFISLQRHPLAALGVGGLQRAPVAVVGRCRRLPATTSLRCAAASWSWHFVKCSSQRSSHLAPRGLPARSCPLSAAALPEP